MGVKQVVIGHTSVILQFFHGISPNHAKKINLHLYFLLEKLVLNSSIFQCG